MCGRYYRRSDKQRIGDAFNISDLPSSLIFSEDYNVAPTTFQPVIRTDRETGDRELVPMRWGLVPFFTKQLSDVKGISTINARAETVDKSPTWKTPFHKRRCLAPTCIWPVSSGPSARPGTPSRHLDLDAVKTLKDKVTRHLNV